MRRVAAARREAEEKKLYAPNDMATRPQQAVVSNVESNNLAMDYPTNRKTIDEWEHGEEEWLGRCLRHVCLCVRLGPDSLRPSHSEPGGRQIC